MPNAASSRNRSQAIQQAEPYEDNSADEFLSGPDSENDALEQNGANKTLRGTKRKRPLIVSYVLLTIYFLLLYDVALVHFSCLVSPNVLRATVLTDH